MHPGQCMSCDPDHVINNVCTGKRFKITSFKRNLLYNKVGVAIVGVADNNDNHSSYLSRCLNRKFDHVAESVLPVLITVLQSSAKVRSCEHLVGVSLYIHYQGDV